MPDLPAVETIANGVNRRVRGDAIVSAWFSHYQEPFKTPTAEMIPALAGLRIGRVRRVGKHIVIDLTSKAGRATTKQLLVHLGMTGRLLIAKPDVPLPPHTHAILRLASGRGLRFVDARLFGRIELLAGADFKGPGHEPLTIPPDDFVALFRGRKLAIKAAPLNHAA